ncbi:Scr1 family TA system antitoxin-like transcriptional regulator [Streptomyces sp. WAC08241]|uniref:Scr1 family TA system antitoxin-like transcriptional regulator n=1 Tax=Streptomyces sp. WAC08241 TaxID=2487421 RepID=UPI001C8D9965|nr:Scr1 family TA system antitoxin-like transcriptional regulator [Streptomyces sp. WAC08241]
MPGSVPWRERLSAGTEAVQDEVIRWYRHTREGKAYVPDMIWGTLQTEAYAAVVLEQVVTFHGVPNDVAAGVTERMQRQRVLHDGGHHYHVVLGEQALYTNIGGPEVMREQIARLLRDVELVSSELDITDEGEVALHHKVFDLLSAGASYGEAARGLLRKALSFWAEASPPVTKRACGPVGWFGAAGNARTATDSA